MRVLAAVLVAMYHVNFITFQMTTAEPFSALFHAGASRGVDVFFVMNGFAIVYAYGKDIGRSSRFADFVFRRTSRIYPAVWIVTCFAVVVYWAGFGGAGKAAKITVENFITTSLLLPSEGIALVNVTWTLKLVMLFYLLFALGILNRRLGILALVLWQVAIVARNWAGLQSTASDSIYLNSVGLDFGFGMAAGYFIARMARRNHPFRPTLPLMAAAGGVLGFVGAKIFEAYLPTSNGFGNYAPFAFGSTAALTLVGASAVELGRKISIPKWMTLIGAASYSIYLLNYSVISVAAHILARLDIDVSSESVALSLLVLAVVAGLSFDAAIDRPIQLRLNAWWKARSSRLLDPVVTG